MMDRKKYMICFPLLMIAVASVLCHFLNERLLFKFCKEDGFVEWSTVLFYFIAAYFFIFEKKGWKNFWSMALGLLCIVIAGEEASWGQRVFGYHTPEAISAVNVQREFNLHNLSGLQGIVRSLGLMVFSVLCFLIPITNHFSEKCRRLYMSWHIPIFPMYAAVIVAFAMLLMAVPRLFFGTSFFNLDEIGELYLGLAMFFFSLSRARA
jgi:hypothetical protein